MDDIDPQKLIFVIARNTEREALRWLFVDAGKAIPTMKEVPGYVDFSIEGGYNAKGKNKLRAVDGITIAKRGDGDELLVGSGDINIGSEHAFKQSRWVAESFDNEFRVYVNELCYVVPLPKEANGVLQMLLAKQPQFKGHIPKLMPK
jgi:hypothetical protein